MAEATTTHGFWELMRIARWHVEGEAYDRALSMVVEAQAALPMAAVWGTGRTASSDGQFFPAAGRGEALNLVNARYGTEPGVKAYSHVSDRFSPFATQTIPATVHEAPYILDGLLMNETGRRVREQYADTGGFIDHVFAACSILGYTFVPRIRDLPSKRLYVFERAGVPKQLRPLVGGKVNADLIDRNWADILRVAATMAAGTMRPSQILRKLAAYPRQNELAAALREVGRVERSLFMIDWTTDPDMRRRAQVGLKGEAHHALKRAINFHQRGELRDRTEEGQHYRLAGLNLLAAIIIYWNTRKLGEAVFTRKNAGLDVPAEFLAHVSPLGWEHINLTGEYPVARCRPTFNVKTLTVGFRPLQLYRKQPEVVGGQGHIVEFASVEPGVEPSQRAGVGAARVRADGGLDQPACGRCRLVAGVGMVGSVGVVGAVGESFPQATS